MHVRCTPPLHRRLTNRVHSGQATRSLARSHSTGGTPAAHLAGGRPYEPSGLARSHMHPSCRHRPLRRESAHRPQTRGTHCCSPVGVVSRPQRASPAMEPWLILQLHNFEATITVRTENNKGVYHAIRPGTGVCALSLPGYTCVGRKLYKSVCNNCPDTSIVLGCGDTKFCLPESVLPRQSQACLVGFPLRSLLSCSNPVCKPLQ